MSHYAGEYGNSQVSRNSVAMAWVSAPTTTVPCPSHYSSYYTIEQCNAMEMQQHDVSKPLHTPTSCKTKLKIFGSILLSFMFNMFDMGSDSINSFDLMGYNLTGKILEITKTAVTNIHGVESDWLELQWTNYIHPLMDLKVWIRMFIWYTLLSVSYTHLTLPTNREV